MSLRTRSEQTFVAMYRDRIGDPSTDDEAQGYWIFAVGALLGIAGLLLAMYSSPSVAIRQWAVVLAAGGLAMVFAGPVIRLPLRRSATVLVYLGLAICAAAILWFVLAFPDQWSSLTGNPAIIGLYGLGLLAMATGGVFVPILTGRADIEAQVSSLQDELDTLRGVLQTAEADEAATAELIADLREALEDADADEDDLARAVDHLRNGLAAADADEAATAEDIADLREALEDADADEGDLAARLATFTTSQSRFERYEDDGTWHWRLRHRNGNVIATSDDGYTREHNAANGIRAVRRDALGAETFAYDEPEALPAADEPFVPVGELESKATFEHYEDRGGDWRWRLRHDNGDIIADGGQGYADEDGVVTAIEQVKVHVGPAEYLWPDPTAFEVYEDAGGEWRWRLLHENGNILAASGQGYSTRSNARRAIDTLRERAGELEFETYEDDAAEYRWRLRGGNDGIVAISGEGYTEKASMEDAVEAVRAYVPEADVLEIGQATFEIFEDTAGDARWRLRHRNGNIIADGGQGYADAGGARDGIESVKRNAPNAEITAPDSPESTAEPAE